VAEAFSVYAVSWKGPAPTGLSERPVSFASKAVGLTIIPVLPASRVGIWKFGSLSLSTTVSVPCAVIEETVVSCEATSEPDSVRLRLRLLATAVASSTVPSLNFRPERRVKVTSVPAVLYFQALASAGIALPAGSSWVRPA
jgi:hypothetical protein